MNLIYQIIIRLYGAIIYIASPFSLKARQWLNGRKNLEDYLPNGTTENIIWFHCASLGEYMQAKPLIEALKEIKSFYETKGTDAAIETLFRVLYGVHPKIVNLEELLIKPSAAEYLRRETVIVEVLSGNPIGLVGQTIRKIERLYKPDSA